MDLPDAETARDGLLAEWAASQPRRPGSRRGRAHHVFEASLDAVEQAPAPPAGLAVGHIDDGTGGMRIGVRAALSGPKLRRAKALATSLAGRGVPVDFKVIPQPMIAPHAGQEAGELDAAGAAQALFAGHFRPLYVGSSVSHEAGPAGTIGAFVRLRDGRAGVLSCSHVLALGGDAREGDFVCQPAQQDQAVAVAGNRIGTLSGKFAPLIAGRPNNLDAAIAFLDVAPEALSFGNRIPSVVLPGAHAIPSSLQGRQIGAVASVAGLARQTRVAKIGRSSGYTEGFLTLTGLTNFTPRLQRKGVWGTYPFPDVIEVASIAAGALFARGGDSGALVFTLPDLQPVGIHFCSIPLQDEPSLNYLMPMDRICAMLDVEVL